MKELRNAQGRKVICMNRHRLTDNSSYCSRFGKVVSDGCCQECVNTQEAQH